MRMASDGKTLQVTVPAIREKPDAYVARQEIASSSA